MWAAGATEFRVTIPAVVAGREFVYYFVASRGRVVRSLSSSAQSPFKVRLVVICWVAPLGLHLAVLRERRRLRLRRRSWR